MKQKTFFEMSESELSQFLRDEVQRVSALTNASAEEYQEAVAEILSDSSLDLATKCSEIFALRPEQNRSE